MMYSVPIKKNSTGEVLVYHDKLPWGPAMDFQWTDGNYGCDCNRHLFFHRAAGGEAEEDCECGEKEYTCEYAELEDGTRVPLDSER